MLEQLEILRRIAERGKALAEQREADVFGFKDGYESFIDTFIHLLDEIENTKEEVEKYIKRMEKYS